MGGGDGQQPSEFKERTNPVENVSWDDARVFIKQLNKIDGAYTTPPATSGSGHRIAGTKTTVVRLPMAVRGRVVIAGGA